MSWLGTEECTYSLQHPDVIRSVMITLLLIMSEIFFHLEKFTGWEILQNGGDQWAIKNLFAPHPDDTVTKCFVTSYG